jgi:hypothetical protein
MMPRFAPRAAVVAALALASGSAPAQTLEGVVDLHAHFGPDAIPRSIDAFSLVKLMRDRGVRAMVLKSHYEPTASLAALAGKQFPGIEVFGGLALNRPAGGVNPAAVEHLVKVEGGRAKVVWMPTFDSENQVRFNKQNRDFVPVSTNGKLRAEVLVVLDLIAKHDLVLATGHSTAAENLLLIQEAKRRGVKRTLVTHAMHAPVSMTVGQCRAAALEGAMIEFIGNTLLGQTKSTSYDEYARAMRAIGLDHCILSSDLGQAGNPLHPDGLLQMFAGFRKAGLSEADINRIAKANPARLVGLPPQ